EARKMHPRLPMPGQILRHVWIVTRDEAGRHVVRLHGLAQRREPGGNTCTHPAILACEHARTNEALQATRIASKLAPTNNCTADRRQGWEGACSRLGPSSLAMPAVRISMRHVITLLSARIVADFNEFHREQARSHEKRCNRRVVTGRDREAWSWWIVPAIR